MENEVFDIKIYHADDDRNPNRPRRIREGEYHIEWHRTGIQFKECPVGKIHSKSGIVGDVEVEPNKIVTWQKMMKPDSENEEFQYIQADGNILYVFRIIKRKPDDWLDWCTKVPDNFNEEVLWMIAQIYEDQSHSTTKEIRKINEDLNKKVLLPLGINDSLRSIILEVWQRRLEESLVRDLHNYSINRDEGSYSISDAVELLKDALILSRTRLSS